MCSLQDMLRELGRCSEQEAVVYVQQLVEFFDYCQSSKLGCIIVHCDLKPANILLRMDDSSQWLTLAHAASSSCQRQE
jgi:serine/threonine protein kinase